MWEEEEVSQHVSMSAWVPSRGCKGCGFVVHGCGCVAVWLCGPPNQSPTLQVPMEHQQNATTSSMIGKRVMVRVGYKQSLMRTRRSVISLFVVFAVVVLLQQQLPNGPSPRLQAAGWSKLSDPSSELVSAALDVLEGLADPVQELLAR